MKNVCQGFQIVERLGRGDDDSGLAACFDVEHGILRDPLVEHANFVNAAHDAPHLRNRRPCKL